MYLFIYTYLVEGNPMPIDRPMSSLKSCDTDSDCGEGIDCCPEKLQRYSCCTEEYPVCCCTHQIWGSCYDTKCTTKARPGCVFMVPGWI